MNTYNMDKMYESYASGMETMQMWLDESEQENKHLKEVIEKALDFIDCHFKEMVADEEAQELKSILKEVE